MTYVVHRFSQEDDAHATLTVLEKYGLRCGMATTRVMGVHDADADHTEWEVWMTTDRRPEYDTEPDEHDRGQSMRWDEGTW